MVGWPILNRYLDRAMSSVFLDRRNLLCAAAGASAALATGCLASSKGKSAMPEPLFRISLAQWSLHRTLRSGELDNLEFAGFTRERFGLGAVEYVNQFFAGRAEDAAYLGEMKARADDAGVRSLLIMIDGEGQLADTDDAARAQAVENHRKWIEAAAFLGCHSIRVNAGGGGTWEEQRDRAADSLRRLAEWAEPHDVDVIVENHGGLSSNGRWLAEVMLRADHPRVGTLPDFGNFHLGDDEWYDRYEGVAELMPFAKAVSAKSHEFDSSGDEVHTDYRRMLGLVKAAGYRGYVGIEYEGSAHGEVEGIRLTQRLLERVREELS